MQNPPQFTGKAAPLSASQRRLWILHQLDPEDPSFNRPMAMRLTGGLHLPALESSLQEIIRRHEILRTTFCDIEGEPMQIVLPADSVVLESIDLQCLPAAQRQAEAKRIAAAEARKIFDLSKGPLVRPMLLRLGAHDHVLLLLMHHIVFDGWSEEILLRELSQLYARFGETGALPLSDLPMQYADFASWQQERFERGALEQPLRYWKRQLAGVQPLWLPSDYPRANVRNSCGAQFVFNLPPAVAAALRELGRCNQATLFMVLSAAFHAFLGRYTGQDDITVGVPIAGRASVETEGLIGCFMNVLVLRTRCGGYRSFRELLASVKDTALEAYTYQEVPFERLVEELRPERSLDRWPLFQVLFNFRNLPPLAALPLADLRIEPFEFDMGLIGGIDLSFEVIEEPDGLHCSFGYPVNLFRPTTINRMASHFRILVEGLLARPEERLSSLPLLSAAERDRLLVLWNNTARTYSGPRCIHEMFQLQAQRTPEMVAVLSEERPLTYAELDERSNQLARYLKKRGVGSEDRVGICLERSCEMLIAILAVLKAGGAYVPLEPAYPAERIGFILADSGIRCILTRDPWVSRWTTTGVGLGERHVIALDREQSAISEESNDRLLDAVLPEHLAYIIYTSGSTGAPKGVMATHGGVCNYLNWRSDYFPLTSSDRLLQRSSFSFDDSVWEFFEPLTVGATVVMADPDDDRDVSYLLGLIDEYKITAACFVPSMLEALLERPDLHKCESLRRVTTGAEPLSPAIRERFLARLTADLYNGYGPTEATIGATFWACERGLDVPVVPIGRPIANTKIYILDADFQPVPIGIPGELFIAGEGLARGYFGRPELTAESFLPNPWGDVSGERCYRTGDRARYLEDGNIEFLGRSDEQVKIRGLRIELGEVEAWLRQYSDILEAAAVVFESSAYDKRLVAYVAPRSQSCLDPEAVRSFLQKNMPAYMIPAAIIALERLPRTATGKVDRRRLAAMNPMAHVSESAGIRPRTELEKSLASHWCEALGMTELGVRDNFFSLGGHSLLATRLLSRIRSAIGVDLTLRALFENPTVEQLAQFILQHQDDSLAKALSDLEALPEDQAELVLNQSHIRPVGE